MLLSLVPLLSDLSRYFYTFFPFILYFFPSYLHFSLSRFMRLLCFHVSPLVVLLALFYNTFSSSMTILFFHPHFSLRVSIHFSILSALVVFSLGFLALYIELNTPRFLNSYWTLEMVQNVCIMDLSSCIMGLS